MPKKPEEIAPLDGSFDAVAAKMVKPGKGIPPRAAKSRKNAKPTKEVEELIGGFPASTVRSATIACGDEQRALEGLNAIYPHLKR